MKILISVEFFNDLEKFDREDPKKEHTKTTKNTSV